MKASVLAGTLLAASMTAFPATAQDEGNISALVLMQRSSTDGGGDFVMVEGLNSVAVCLDLAWMNSVAPPQWSYPAGVTVSCLSDGEIVGGQTCYRGACNALEPSTMR